MAKQDPLPLSAIRRVSLAVASRVLAAPYGTPIGLMSLAGEITEGEYDAALWFDRLHAVYRRAIGVREVRGQSLEIGSASTPSDPNSPKGERQAKQRRERQEPIRGGEVGRHGVRGRRLARVSKCRH